jgi:hypothetical protein
MSYTASNQISTVDRLPGGKAEGCDADHSPPSSAEVKKDGAIPALPFMSSWHNANKDNCTHHTAIR